VEAGIEPVEPDGNGTRREAAVPLAVDDWQIGTHFLYL
jgi:hypothetical protein